MNNTELSQKTLEEFKRLLKGINILPHMFSLENSFSEDDTLQPFKVRICCSGQEIFAFSKRGPDETVYICENEANRVKRFLYTNRKLT